MLRNFPRLPTVHPLKYLFWAHVYQTHRGEQDTYTARVTRNGVCLVKMQGGESFQPPLPDRVKHNTCLLGKKSANLFLKVVNSLVGIYGSTYLCCTVPGCVDSAGTSVAKRAFISLW